MVNLSLAKAEAPEQANVTVHLDQGRRVRSRPLLLMERTMYRDGHTPFLSLFSIKLRGRLDELQLRSALQRLQSKHPLLRCVVDNSWDRPVFVLRGEPTPLSLRIVDRWSEDQWEEELRREWLTPFHGAAGALVRFVWLRGSGIHNLIVSGHHCICDGQAGIGLLQDLLRACHNPECNIGSYDELGSLEDIVPPAILQDPAFQRRLRWRRRGLECVLWWKTRHRTKPAPIETEDIYFQRSIFSREFTRSIAERSKAEKVSLLPPIALAFMQAFRDLRGSGAFQKVNAMVNARRFADRLLPDALFGIAPGVPMRVKDLPAPTDTSVNTFWKRARAIKSDLDKSVSHLGTVFYQYLSSLERLHHKYNSVVEYFEGAPAIRPLTFSNMGRLALGTQYGDLRVEKVYSPLVMVSPTPANTVVLSSFCGEMEIAIISDQQSLPRQDALGISRRAAEILQASIGGPK